MNADFETKSALQIRLKAAQRRIESLENGQALVNLKKEYARDMRFNERQISRLKKELGQANARIVTVRKNWSEVMDDVYAETDRKLREKDRYIEKLEKRILEVERQRDAALDKVSEKQKELYAVLSELEDEKGKNRKLTAQINRDYENSSKPSSDKPLRKKINNNRKKTEKRPGGQPGHTGHRRRCFQPTQEPVFIEAPEEIIENPDYYTTGKVIRKQVVDIHMNVDVMEYRAFEYRRHSNGSRYHAPFPEGVRDDVNYGSSVKAFAFCLNNYCNVSIRRTGEFLEEITDGKVRLSAGAINGLGKKFSMNTAQERKEIFTKLLACDVMHTDNTTSRVNGSGKSVLICAQGELCLYFLRDSKGHEGVKGTPVEFFQGTLVHDHDRTFYAYGSSHQECLAHVLRYLKNSMDNEPELKWNRKMHSFLENMIHEYKQADGKLSQERINQIRTEYDEILKLACREYEYVPPSDYYREGFNLQKRLREYRESHLYFLEHPQVEYTNNLSERGLRKFKRKQKQAVTFRSQENAGYFCDALSIIETNRLQGGSVYQTVKCRF